jgi:hypothetical protein
MAGAYAYQVQLLRTSISTAITVVQVKAAANASIDISDIAATMRASTTSAMETLQLVRKSAAASVNASTVFQRNTGDPAPSAAASSSANGVNASAEGTNTDVVDEWSFNVLNGLAWVYIPELRIHVAAAGILGLTFPSAPAANTFSFKVGFFENR